SPFVPWLIGHLGCSIARARLDDRTYANSASTRQWRMRRNRGRDLADRTTAADSKYVDATCDRRDELQMTAGFAQRSNVMAPVGMLGEHTYRLCALENVDAKSAIASLNADDRAQRRWAAPRGNVDDGLVWPAWGTLERFRVEPERVAGILEQA